MGGREKGGEREQKEMRTMLGGLLEEREFELIQCLYHTPKRHWGDMSVHCAIFEAERTTSLGLLARVGTRGQAGGNTPWARRIFASGVYVSSGWTNSISRRRSETQRNDSIRLDIPTHVRVLTMVSWVDRK